MNDIRFLFQVMLKAREKQLNEIQSEIMSSHSRLRSFKDSLVSKFSVGLAQSSVDMNFKGMSAVSEESAVLSLDLRFNNENSFEET